MGFQLVFSKNVSQHVHLEHMVELTMEDNVSVALLTVSTVLLIVLVLNVLQDTIWSTAIVLKIVLKVLITHQLDARTVR